MNKSQKNLPSPDFYPTASSFKDWRLSFFWFLAAADEDLLRRCPSTEQYKHATIGAAILLTAVAAAISGYFAFYLLLKNWVALPVALFWSIIIFNLDRFMVGSIRKDEDDSPWKQIKVALPRLVLATLIAFLISRPIEVKIFENQINQEQVNITQRFVDTIIQEKIVNLEKEITRLEEAKTNLMDLTKQSGDCANAPGFTDAWLRYISCKKEYDELSGKKTAFKMQQNAVRADPRYYYIVNDSTNKNVRLLNQEGDAEIDRLQRQIVSLNIRMSRLGCAAMRQSAEDLCTKYNLRLDKTINNEVDYVDRLDDDIEKAKEEINNLKEEARVKSEIAAGDILGKLRALEKLKGKDSAMFWASWLIVLLFFVLETAPLYVKIVSNRGAYDSLLRLKEQKIIFSSETELKEFESDAKRRLHILEDEEGELTQTERQMNKDVMEKIRAAQSKVAEELVNAWEKQELDKIKTNPSEALKDTINPPN